MNKPDNKPTKPDKPNTNQANTNHPNSNPVNSQSGDGSQVSIDNSDNSKGLEYLYKLLETQNLTIQQKDRLIQELQEKRIKDASLVAEIRAKIKEYEKGKGSKEHGARSKGKTSNLKLAGLVATSVVMVGGALVVVYEGDTLFKKDKKVPLAVKNNLNRGKKEKKEGKSITHFGGHANKGGTKKSGKANITRIETEGEEKKTQSLPKMKIIPGNENKKFRPKESFVDAMRRLERERFEGNRVLEGLVKSRSLAKVKGIKAPKQGQVFAKGEKIEIEVDFGVLGGELPINILVRSSKPFAKPVYRVQVKGEKVVKVVLPEIGRGLFYLEVENDEGLLGATKFVIK